MNVRVHREVPTDLEIITTWNELAAKMEEPEVFYTYEWALASATAFADTKRPLIVLVYEEPHLIGIAALAVPTTGHGPVAFLNRGTADYCDFVSAPDARARVISEVLRELSKQNVGELAFSNIPDKSVTVPFLGQAAQKQGFFVAPTTSGRVARLRLGDAEQRKIRKRELLAKRRLRKSLLALQKLGAVTMIDITDWEVIRNYLPNFFDSHVARFASTRRTSLYGSSRYRLFIEVITRLLARQHWLHMFCLTLDKKAIAWGIVLSFGEGWLWYMPTFSLEYERFSPGLVLLRLVLEKALESEAVKLVDFGVGEELYKSRFADSSIVIVGQIVTRSRLSYIRTISMTKTASILRRFPRIESRVRHARQVIHDVCQLISERYAKLNTR